MSDYLRPTAAIACDVLLPSDPALALALGQRLLEKPLMANHSHGLWGYSGERPDGGELSIQSTGIGGPSAAAVLGELAAHGVRRAIRIGRCLALDAGLAPGAVVVVGAAIGADGTSRALGPDPVADATLTEALAGAAGAEVVTVASADLLRPDALSAEVRAAQPVAVDLETAAILALGRVQGLQVACGLVVDRSAAGARSRAETEQGLLELGDAAAAALVAQAPARA